MAATAKNGSRDESRLPHQRPPLCGRPHASKINRNLTIDPLKQTLQALPSDLHAPLASDGAIRAVGGSIDGSGSTPKAAATVEQRGLRSEQQVRDLAELIESDLTLQSFLEALLPQLCQLVGGIAAVVWMRAEGSQDALLGIRYRMDDILQSLADHKKHERLVQLAWKQRGPMLAEPRSSQSPAGSPAEAPLESPSEGQAGAGQAGAGASANPTGYPLLFSPVLHLQEPVGLLEVVLPASGVAGIPTSRRTLYLRGIQLIAERVYSGMRQRMALPTATADLASKQLESLSADVQKMQHEIVLAIQSRLKTFEGWAFESLADKQAFAKMLHGLLDRHGLRVRCPECGSAAILRCLRAGNAKHGAFAFDHYLDSGRTFHGGTTIVPRIEIVPKPARRVSAKSSA